MAFLLTTRTCCVGLMLAFAALMILPSLAIGQKPSVSPGATPLPLLQEQGTTDLASACKTSTFLMRLPAATGHQVDLRAVQTLPGGDFIAVGNTTAPNGEQQGLLLQINNSGSIVAQRVLRINNQPVTLFSAKVMLSGHTVIGGVLRDGSRNVFAALVKSDGSIAWVNTLAVQADPLKVKVDVFDDSLVALAVQQAASVVYASLKTDGSLRWKKEVAVDGLTDLVGFGNLSWSPLALVVNCVQNGKRAVRAMDIAKNSGSITAASLLNDAGSEGRALATTANTGRLITLGVVNKPGTGFELERNILYTALRNETKHAYQLAVAPEFSWTGAMDNAGDALGLCLPQQGKLVYIRQLSDYSTIPEYTRQYDVPVGSSLAGLTRSFDGGYLFALNTAGGAEVLLMKTDSIGVLAGCGYGDMANTFRQQLNTLNTDLPAMPADIALAPVPASVALSAASLTPRFDCRQNYCPPPPVADTCLDTYFKVFRSNSHVNSFTSYHLMRNNRHLTGGTRYERVIGGGNQMIYGLKLFDEGGQFIKGVTHYLDGVTRAFTTTKITDSTIMLLTYSGVAGVPGFTFTLVSDDLQVLWSKTIKTPSAVGFGDGMTSMDIHKDEEGNYYLAGSSLGFNARARVMVYKMDASGNGVWFKVYEISKGSLGGPVRVLTTRASVIAIIEGRADGSATVRLDKATGQVVNGFLYQNNFAGSLYRRLATLDQDRIFYAGNNGNSDFVMGLFDTTGRPLKLRYIDNSSSLRAGVVKSGMLYASYKYYNGSAYKDVLLKADTALNLVFAHEFDFPIWGYPSGLEVSDQGYIYAGGNYTPRNANGHYYDPFLIKFNLAGELGTCGYEATQPPVVPVDPKTEVVSFIPQPASFTPLDMVPAFVPDTEGQVVNAILCSSTVTCTGVELSGPEAVCQLDKDITYPIRRNATCTLSPLFVYDTSLVRLRQLTDTSVTVQFKKQGNTWLKVRLNAGCQVYEDSLQVNTTVAVPRLDLGADTTLCNGQVLVLSPKGSYASYKWQDGASGAAYPVTQPGTYSVEVRNGCGETASDTVVVGSLVIPFDVGGDRVKCNSDTVHLRAPSGFTSYAWSNDYKLSSTSAQGVVVNPLVDTAYYVKAEKFPGCFVYDTVRVTVNHAPPISLGPDTSFCAGGEVWLDAGPGFARYEWSTGAATPQLRVQVQGSYSVRAITAEGCSAYDTLRVVRVFANPVVRLDKNDALCAGSSQALDAGAFASYLWQDGSTGRRLVADKVGTYFVQVTDANGCRGSDTTSIRTIHPLPKGFLPLDTAICSYSRLELRPQGSFASYHWNTGAVTPTQSIEKPAVYWLEVKDRNNCTGRDSVVVGGKECMRGLYVPTGFTPDRDGRNDLFRPLLFGNVVSLEFTVYNRWGEVVFTTTDRTRGWDGTYKGRTQDSGVFVWLCRYRLDGEEEKLEKGTVTLIR